MLYKEKTFDAVNDADIDKKIWQLGIDVIKKQKEKKSINEYARQIAVFYLTYLFGLRVSEAVKVNIYTDLAEISKDGVTYYRLKSINAKQKSEKDKVKVIFLYPFNEYELKMLNFIKKNWQKVTYWEMVNFAKRHIITEFFAYDKDGREVKVQSHLNIHALRHIRAFVLLRRYKDKDLVQRLIGWKSEAMLKYYTRIAKEIEVMTLEKDFIDTIKTIKKF